MSEYLHVPAVIPGRRHATVVARHTRPPACRGRLPRPSSLAAVPETSTATPAGTLRSDPDTPGGAMSEQDDFPERFHRDRREHGGASQYIDNDQDEQLARLTEEERVAAGLDAYDPDEVPPTRHRSPRTSRRTRTGRKSGPSSGARRTRASSAPSTSLTRSRPPPSSDR